MSKLFRLPALQPFRGRDYRRLWSADLLTSGAFEMENIILAWYIQVETNDVTYLALYGSLIYVGTLVSPMFGVTGDRIGHRNLLAGMRFIYALLAATLTGLALAGLLSPVLVLCVVAGVGLVRPSDLGVRAALVSAIVPSGQLMSASGMQRITVESARIFGALIGAALVYAVGMAHAYIAILLCYLAAGMLTLGVAAPARVVPRDAGGQPVARPSPWRDLKEGLAYVWRTPQLKAGMLIAFIANLTAYPMSNGLLPYVAKEIYHIDQAGLSYLVAGFAGGGLIGSIILSLMGGAARAGRMCIIFGVVWHLMLLVFPRMPTPAMGFAMLMLAGMCQTLSLVSLTVLLLKTADERLRGRVMGVRMLAIYGLPVGLMTAGWLIKRIGFVETATSYALFGLVAMLAIAYVWRRVLWPAEAASNAR